MAVFSKDELDAFRAQTFQPAAQQQQQPKKKGNPLLNLLPMVTGTIGAVGGGLLGSVLPGVGTAAVGAAGGAGGAAAGEWLRQKLSGEADDGIDKGNLVEEGVLGALPGVLKGAKLLHGGTAAKALDTAGDVARVADAAGDASRVGRAASAKAWLGSKLSSFGGARPGNAVQGQIETLRNAGKTDEAIKLAQGITDPGLKQGMLSSLGASSARPVVDPITKKIIMQPAAGAATSAVTGAADDVGRGGVRGWLGNKLSSAADTFAEKSVRSTPSQNFAFKSLPTGERLGTFLNRTGSVGKSSTEFGKTVVKGTMDDFGKAVTNIQGKVTVDDIIKANRGGQLDKLLKSDLPKDRKAGQEAVDILNEIFGRNKGQIDPTKLNQLKGRLDAAVTQGKRASQLTQADEAAADAIRTTLQNLDETGRLKTIGLESQKAKQALDILSRQEEVGRGAGALGFRDLLSMGAMGGVGGVAGGIPGMVAGVALNRAANSPKVAAFMANKLATYGAKLAGKAAPKVIETGAKGVAKDYAKTALKTQLPIRAMQFMGGAADANATAAGSEQAGTQVDEGGMPPMDQNNLLSIMGAGGIDGAGAQPTSMYSMENAVADMQRDPQNADYYMKLYAFMNPEGESQQVKKTESQRARDEAADITKMALQQLEGGSIATGVVGSKLQGAREFFGVGDQETLDFNTTVSSLQAAIAKARAGTSFTPNEQRLLNRYTPKVGDTGQQLRSKLNFLNQIFDRASEREAQTQYQPDIAQIMGAGAGMGTPGAY